MKEIQAFKITVQDMDAFVEELMAAKVRKVYREVKDSGQVVYTCWSPTALAFVTCDFYIPEVIRLQDYEGKYEGRNAYRHPWKTKAAQLEHNPGSKRSFTRALKALGANRDIIKEYNKITVRKMMERVEAGAGDEDGDIIETTSRESGGTLRVLIPVDWEDGLVKEVAAQFEIKGHRHSLEYILCIEDWKRVQKALIDRHEEELFTGIPELNIVDGSIVAI